MGSIEQGSTARRAAEDDLAHRDDLRGSVDGWDFKQYVLGVLFYRFISENLVAYLNEAEKEAGETGFDYVAIQEHRGLGRRCR